MPPMPPMSWMRVAIGVGALGLLAGVVGMVSWINDGSHYFEAAVAVSSAGFLTLVACVLTQVFGSSHGSQDDAFRRGKSMGYDEGFLAGRRTARPVVVPMPLAGPATEILTSGVEPEPEIPPDGGRHPRSLMSPDVRRHAVEWVRARRTPLAAGALCLFIVGVLAASAFVDGSMPAAGGSTSASGAMSTHAQPPTGTGGWSTKFANPAIPGVTFPGAGRPGAGLPGSAVAQISPLGTHGGAPAGSTFDANGNVVVPASVRAPGAAPLTPGAVYPPGTSSAPGYTPALTPVVAPAPAAPAVPLTAAQQTAKNAADAAALTAANAARDAALTAANATEAARVTAANAAAAAAATAKTAACAAEGKVC